MLRKTVLVRALSIAFGVAALSAAVVMPAMAQSNAAGNIFGRVDSPAGATVVLNNTDTGAKRIVTPDASGSYNATAMSPGHYKVELVRAGKVENSTEIDVIVGQGVDASFVASAVQAVQVTGRRSRIDVSNSNNGATFTAKELARLPIAQNVAAIIQLAPNTTRADSRYAAGASFGGGGASENAYYINGFPTTNPLTQLGSSELPFGAIAQAQILTGGFGSEFGRSVGGVVNITTKSGTNNWEFGAMASIEPNSLKSDYKDLYYGKTGKPENAATDGTLYATRKDNKRTEKIYGAYVGGPIIKDKLFMFTSIETKRIDREAVNGTRLGTTNAVTGYAENQDKIDRYMSKFDWNITDNHRIEVTFLGDTPKTDRQLYSYQYADATHPVASHGTALKASQHYKNDEDWNPSVGAETQIARYTGNLTDNLTVQALVGRSKTKNESRYDVIGTPVAGDLYQVSAPTSARYPGLNYTSTQVLSGLVAAGDAQSKIDSARLDLEYKLGRHTLRAGIDDNKLTSNAAGEVYGGGGTWTYSRTLNPTVPISFGDGKLTAPASGGGLGAQGYYVTKRVFDSRTDAKSDQSAIYLEDRFQATKDLLLTVGLRSENFKNKNGDGETFLEVKNELTPRFAAAWDVNGDASFKVFGSAGRYALQIPTHLAVRGASRSLNVRQVFTYTGTDAQGLPTGLTPLTGVFSTNNEVGQAKDAKTLTAIDIKPTLQDELTVGFEKAFNADLNFGAKVTYRKLADTIDDFCDARPFYKYAEDHNINADNYSPSCQSFNPGKANSFYVDYANDGKKNYTVVNLSKADLGFDKAKRTYAALDLFAEHPLRNGWYGRINYTWSRSEGNTEGQTKSDNAQTDVAATSTWDNRELMVGADGLLPNNRTHQFKAYGFYEFNSQLTVGANGLAASGRPLNCFGNQPNLPADADDYGSVYFNCDGASPRGSKGKLPWDIRLDANVVFRPVQVSGLALKVDVFNVFNKQTVQTVDETYNLGGTTVSSTYGRVISYTAPRSLKLTAEYNYKF